MGLFSSSLTEILARVIVLFTAISVHEFAHGFIAYKLGDPTAKYSGRLTLNPLSHLDPIGAICMALFISENGFLVYYLTCFLSAYAVKSVEYKIYFFIFSIYFMISVML